MASIFKTISTVFKDSWNLTAFNRLRTAGEGNRVDLEFIYDKQDDIADEVINGTGTATFNTNPRDITLAVNGTGLTASAGMYTYPCPYTPGNGQLIAITGVMDLANIGGGDVELFLRTNVSGVIDERTQIVQSSWTNWTSGIDWSKSQILEIDFQSLKVGRIRFALNSDGVITPLGEIYNDNRYNTGYWQYPQQSAFWNIYNNGTDTIMEMGYGDNENAVGLRYTIPINASATMKAICATVKSEGGQHINDLEGLNRGISMGATTATVSTSLIPLISIRPKITFNSLPNRGIALPKNFTLYTDNPIHIVVLHDVTLTGSPAWADVDGGTGNSMMEYDVSASGYSNGHSLIHDYAGGAKNTGSTSGNILGKTVLWNRRGTRTGIITLAAVRVGTTNASVAAGFNWSEIR